VKAYYDSEANALSIDLIDVPHWDDGEEVDDDYCSVAFSDGRLANVELLNPRENLRLLDVAAERFDLELGALRNAARAALAEPDQTVRLGNQLAA